MSVCAGVWRCLHHGGQRRDHHPALPSRSRPSCSVFTLACHCSPFFLLFGQPTASSGAAPSEEARSRRNAKEGHDTHHECGSRSQVAQLEGGEGGTSHVTTCSFDTGVRGEVGHNSGAPLQRLKAGGKESALLSSFPVHNFAPVLGCSDGGDRSRPSAVRVVGRRWGKEGGDKHNKLRARQQVRRRDAAGWGTRKRRCRGGRALSLPVSCEDASGQHKRATKSTTEMRKPDPPEKVGKAQNRKQNKRRRTKKRSERSGHKRARCGRRRAGRCGETMQHTNRTAQKARTTFKEGVKDEGKGDRRRQEE